MRTKYPRHLAGFSYLGIHQHSLTFCTAGRARPFIDAASVSCANAQILRAAEDEYFAEIAYCYMPDHLHLVVEGTSEQSDLKRFIARAKQLSSYHYKQKTGVPLWQRYGYEHVLRGDDHLATTVRYIIENPVRAGLVCTPATIRSSDRVFTRCPS